MAAPFLVERGIDPAGDGIGPALIMRLLMDLPATVPTYFRQLADQPRMAEALWAAISRAPHGRPDRGRTSGRDAFANPSKHAELRALAPSVRGEPREPRASPTAPMSTARPWSTWTCARCFRAISGIELPGIAWAPLERRLLDALPGTASGAAALSTFPGSRPRAACAPSARRWRSSSPRPPPMRSGSPISWSPPAPPPRGDGTLQLFRAGGREAEVEEVFRRIAAAGVAARPGRDRLPHRRRCRARLGEGAAPRVARDGAARRARHLHAARPRARSPSATG